jgi:hypothetical protein
MATLFLIAVFIYLEMKGDDEEWHKKGKY